MYEMRYIIAIPALIFFLRFILQYTHCNFYHPLSIITNNITQYPIKFLGNYNIKNINISALLCSFISMELCGFLFLLAFGNQLNLEGIIFVFFFNIVILIDSIFMFFLAALFISAILSWIPNPKVYSWHQIMNNICSPILRPLEKFIPNIGPFSIAFIVAFLLISFIHSTAIISLYTFLFSFFR